MGLHYIGEVQTRRSSTRRLFDHITDGKLEWASIGEVYDRIVFGDDAYDLVAGADEFAAGLGEQAAPGGCDADGNGIVATPDLLALLAAWGTCD